MTDRKTVLAVTIGLVLVVLSGMGSMVVLTIEGHTIPETLGTATTVALGALAALLASTRTTAPEPPVQNSWTVSPGARTAGSSVDVGSSTFTVDPQPAKAAKTTLGVPAPRTRATKRA